MGLDPAGVQLDQPRVACGNAGVVTTPLQTLERRSCTSTNNTTATTIMTLLLLFYMVPYRLTPPSMKGLLFDANPPVVLRPPICPRSGFRLVVSRRLPGPPLKLLSMLCNPGRFEFTPWPTLGKAMLAPKRLEHLDSRFRWFPHWHIWPVLCPHRPPWNCSVCCYRTPLFSYKHGKSPDNNISE